MFVAGDRSYFSNPPHEMTGGMLVLKRSLEGLKIKVNHFMSQLCDEMNWCRL